jgi:hypothetical protein
MLSADKVFIDTGGGDDVITIDALRGNGTIFGGPGNDKLFLDGRDTSFGYELHNTFDGTSLDWNGGEGDDTVELYFVSAGMTNLNIVGDSDGVNTMTARCTDLACTILSRAMFLANIQKPGTLIATIERVNIDGGSTMTNVHLYLNDGENRVYFDNTFAATYVYGGDDIDSFQIGQVSSTWVNFVPT